MRKSLDSNSINDKSIEIVHTATLKTFLYIRSFPVCVGFRLYLNCQLLISKNSNCVTLYCIWLIYNLIGHRLLATNIFQRKTNSPSIFTTFFFRLLNISKTKLWKVCLFEETHASFNNRLLWMNHLLDVVLNF